MPSPQAPLTLTAPNGAMTRITLNNPARRNALSLAMLESLIDALTGAAAADQCRVIIIDGAGPAFSAGHDLAEMRIERNPNFYDGLFGTCTALMQTIHELRVPVIAQVHGVATAAGCQLVAACDLAICTDTTRFATPGVNIGLFCSTPMVPISRAIGRKRAMEMLLTGSMIDATTAVSWGLVNRAVADSELNTACAELANQIASASPQIVAIGKRAFWAQIDEPEQVAYQRAGEVMQANAMLDDAHEGMSAFLEKRSPHWPSETLEERAPMGER